MKRFYFLIFVLIITACSKDSTTEDLVIEYNYDYYPLAVGKYIVYDVDSIVYDPQVSGTFIDTNSYQIKEEIVDTLIDNAGRTAYVIHVQTRKSAAEAWFLERIYTAVRTEIALEKTEDNLPFTKLIFPLKAGASWKGNRLFNDENRIATVRGETLEIFRNWESSILSMGTRETIGSETFEEVLIVRHADDENLIERRFVEEKYARTIGLVEKKVMILDTQCDGDLSNCEGLRWEEKAEKGFILRMTLNSYN